MADRQHWTVMWVPHGAGTTRSMGISYRALKVMGGSAAVLLVIGLVFTPHQRALLLRPFGLPEAAVDVRQGVVRRGQLLQPERGLFDPL